MTAPEKFEKYAAMLRDWNARMNLIAKSQLNEIRTRHIDDSAQLAEYIPTNTKVIDLGSGAGFPAVVLALLGFEVIAIESIAKKCAFLNEVKKELDLSNLTIVNDRVENFIKHLKPQTSNLKLFTARAFAPLSKIFDLTSGAGYPYLLLKGENVMSEIHDAEKFYKFEHTLIPSKTGPGFILSIKNVKKRRSDR